MTPSRSPVAAAGPLLALLVATTAWPACASALQIRRESAPLDGRVVMAPAAERIETILPGGGAAIRPGSTIRRAIIIHNRTRSTTTFDLDVAQVVGSTAELVVEVRHGVREGAASWARLERSTVTLEPGERAALGVTIRVPSRVSPGSKAFAVTATQRRNEPTGVQGAGIAPQFRQVGIFIVELPGEAHVEGRFTRADLTSVQESSRAGGTGRSAPTNQRIYVSPGWADPHDLRLATEYENRGERLLTPSGRVVVRDLFGRTVHQAEIARFTAYPGGSSAGTVPLEGLPSLGVFRVSVVIESEAGGRQTIVLRRFAFLPRWFLVAAAVAGAYSTAAILRWWLRRRWNYREHQGSADELDEAVDGHAEVHGQPY